MVKLGQRLPLALGLSHNRQQSLSTISGARQHLRGLKPGAAAARL